MADFRKHSSTSNIVRFKLTKSTDGTSFTGATFSSTGLIISTICDNEATPTVYTAAGSTIETITTLGTFAAPTATKCRFKEVDATNHPGLYEFQFADARFAIASAKRMVITVGGVASMFYSDYEIQLTQSDVYDSVRLGLTALPNAAADAAGGLPISDAGGLDLDSKLANTNEVTAARMGALTDWINGGRLDLILDIIAADTTTDIPALIAALNNLSAAQVTAAVPTVIQIQSGLATAASLATAITYIDTEIAAILEDTGTTIPAQIAALNNITAASVVAAMGTGTFLTAVPWNAAWDAEVQSEVQDAIEVNHLDHLLAADYDPASKPGVSTALLNELIGSDAGVSQFTANALELAPTGGSAPTAAAIADAVWDEARSGHTTAGTFGFYLDAAISGISAGSGATAQQVWEYATRSLTGAVELDSATQTKINKIEAVATGTVTGAGTSTEVFVGPSATLTITVDSSGNRSNVSVT